MSVPTSKRKVAAMQYVETARRLQRDIFQFSNRLPKRWAQRLSNPLALHAQEAYYEVKTANAIYVTCAAEYEERRCHLNEAMGHLGHVASLLDLAYDLQESPNDNVYGAFADAIDDERKYIRGVKRKDRERSARFTAPEDVRG